MRIFETYAHRKRKLERPGQPDVFQYDILPKFLRAQLSIVLSEALGPKAISVEYGDIINKAWSEVHRQMSRSIESFYEFNHRLHYPKDICDAYLKSSSDVDGVLSLVEIALLIAELAKGEIKGALIDASRAIEEINYRFREHGVGYEYQNNKIVRVDQAFVHAEIIKPVLALLTDPDFSVANKEFMTAHAHYRRGDFKDAITAANRAFETTLKIICQKRKWAFDGGHPAGELIKVVRKNGLFSDHLDNTLDTYVSMMKSGIPHVRNKAGGHGAAPDDPPTTAHLARYAIDLTAANIVMLVNSYRELNKD